MYSALAQGFDECFQGEEHSYYATFDCDGKTLDPHGTIVKQPGYRLETQTAAALAFLKRHHDQPFFLYLAYYGPHVPLEAPEKYLSRFPGEMPERRRHALAMLSAIDDGVGQITDALKQYNIDNNTLLFFTSDNGAPLAAARGKPKADLLPVNKSSADWDGSLNDPWVGEKGMLTEGGIRVPFIMCWPGRLPAGKIYDQPVSTLDIAATAVALAGLPADEQLDGVNLIPHLTSEVSHPPHAALYWRFLNQAAVRSGKWKFVNCTSAAEAKDFQFFAIQKINPPTLLNINTGNWDIKKLDRYEQLFEILMNCTPLSYEETKLAPSLPGVYLFLSDTEPKNFKK
jgi:arylsulfatase A-like enzyme